MPSTIAISKTITIKSGVTVIATGTLAITITPGNPVTVAGTFTPANTTTQIPLTQSSLTWTSTTNGSVLFAFLISSPSPSSAYPAGTYTFTGTQQANGNPTGTVVWPTGNQFDEESDEESDEDNTEGTETDTWQASG